MKGIRLDENAFTFWYFPMRQLILNTQLQVDSELRLLDQENQDLELGLVQYLGCHQLRFCHIKTELLDNQDTQQL